MIAYYKGNYKYQLSVGAIPRKETVMLDGCYYWKHKLGFPVNRESNSHFVKILNLEDDTMYLLIRNGYAWDGASGPTIDTKDTQHASLVHDALWQAISEGNLSEKYRDRTNKEFLRMLLAKGVPKWRANLWYWSVSTFGTRWVKYFGSKRKLIKAQ